MSAARWEPKGPVGRFVNTLEETGIALLLGLMVLVTFVNVVLRYGFNTSLIWGLELVLILFSWLVIFGVSYGFKVTAHLGVDALTNALPHRGRRICALVAGVICVAYALLMLKGAWDFWAPFGNFAPTTGRWFPDGFKEMKIHHFQGYIPTDQVPLPEFLRSPLEAWLLLEGDPPLEKFPRAIPYIILPLGTLLILFRIGQAVYEIVRGTRESLIVSHEAEEAVEDAARAHDETTDVYKGSHAPAGGR
ncbi:TRAP transporter small permease [Jannaschia aquimarina]|uniref:TRAP transporter small permease protein n=1 Tax=Jannaschia aquimarina TaxID=935700 RepID=A0A0D1CR54_9RHOB|nr:TRAP transporter small permease [Jannaschia aquimarina]KIT17252.1 2,3-diketo-L-gulonate TRAP transporter small permease protein YiaM [Jannaschia aquimarina]SNT19125.1 C4-dicarboxylate transporter, DctQ subunit [Jannaschia aquimarina]